MADDESEDEPAVELGEGEPVEGAPLARISARLMWGIEKSAIVEREGDISIRTPDGPRELGEILAEVDSTYFATRQEFEDAVHEVIGTGPIPTAGGATTGEEDGGETETDAAENGDTETDETPASDSDSAEK